MVGVSLVCLKGLADLLEELSKVTARSPRQQRVLDLVKDNLFLKMTPQDLSLYPQFQKNSQYNPETQKTVLVELQSLLPGVGMQPCYAQSHNLFLKEMESEDPETVRKGRECLRNHRSRCNSVAKLKVIPIIFNV